MTPDVRRARAAFWRVGVIAPLSILVLAAILVASWLPEVPEPAAIHWGPGGADGYGPRWTYLVVLLVLGGGMVGLFAVIALFAHRLPRSGAVSSHEPQWSATARLLGAANLAVAGMISFVSVAGMAAQRGLADAADAADITPWVGAALVGMLVLGAAGWLLQPRVAASAGSSGSEPSPLPLADGERAVWLRRVTIARAGQIVLGGSVFVVLAMSVLLWTAQPATGATMLVLAVVLAVLVVSGLSFHVRASDAGLLVRSTLGWPRIDIPAARIARTRVVQVNPFAEFGGWGYRIGTDGRRGVVLRTGEALEVRRDDGKVYVVTVDDAATAASVLAAASHP